MEKPFWMTLVWDGQISVSGRMKVGDYILTGLYWKSFWENY